MVFDKINDKVDSVQKHISVLRAVSREQPANIVDLTNETGYHQHQVNYSLKILEQEQLVEATKHGAVPTDKADQFMNDLNEEIDRLGEQVESLEFSD